MAKKVTATTFVDALVTRKGTKLHKLLLDFFRPGVALDPGAPGGKDQVLQIAQALARGSAAMQQAAGTYLKR